MSICFIWMKHLSLFAENFYRPFGSLSTLRNNRTAKKFHLIFSNCSHQRYHLLHWTPASIGIATLSWWDGLRSPVTPRAMLAGVSYSWQGHPCQTGRRVGARGRVILQALQVGGWAEGWWPSPVKKGIFTETRSRMNSLLMTHGS